MIHEEEPTSSSYVWEEEYSRSLKLDVAINLVDDSMVQLCKYADKLVEDHLVPSGLCDAIDELAESLCVAGVTETIRSVAPVAIDPAFTVLQLRQALRPTGLLIHRSSHIVLFHQR